MRKLCWFALPFCGAAFAACLGLPFLIPVGLIFAALGLLAGCLKRLPVCLACLGIAVGLLWFQGYSLLFRAPAEELAGQSTGFSATVTSFPQETSVGSFRVEARLHLPGKPDFKIILYTDNSGKDLLPGDKISGTARFRSANVVRGEAVSYYEAKGIYLQGSTTGELTCQRPDTPPLSVWPVCIAQAIKDTLITDGYPSVDAVRVGNGYSASLDNVPNQDVLDAIEFVFDNGGAAVQHRVIYFYAPNVCESAFHESQNYVVTHGGHKFFDRW